MNYNIITDYINLTMMTIINTLIEVNKKKKKNIPFQ